MVSQMERGILEILLVNARGIRHPNLIGRPMYYVIIECGAKQQRSKISKGERHSALWNQKIAIEFPISQWKTLSHVKLRIMDKAFFKNGGFVGETRVHLGGIITEGSDKGYIEVKPAPYNVVLDDDTYKGEIKIGFKFIANEKLQREPRKLNPEWKNLKESTSSPVLNLLKITLLKFLFFCFRKPAKHQLKEN